MFPKGNGLSRAEKMIQMCGIRQTDQETKLTVPTSSSPPPALAPQTTQILQEIGLMDSSDSKPEKISEGIAGVVPEPNSGSADGVTFPVTFPLENGSTDIMVIHLTENDAIEGVDDVLLLLSSNGNNYGDCADPIDPVNDLYLKEQEGDIERVDEAHQSSVGSPNAKHDLPPEHDDESVDPTYVPGDIDMEISSSEDSPDERPATPVNGPVSDNIEESPAKKKRRISKKGLTRAIKADRAAKRNRGEEYVGIGGKLVAAKQWRELESCRSKCKERIDSEDRSNVHSEFWGLLSYDRRVAYCASLITIHEKQITRKKVEEISKRRNRQNTHRFYLKIKGEMKTICKRCFLKTLDVTPKFITVVLKKASDTLIGIPAQDGRGRHPPKNKHPNETINAVKDHILSIPSYESHYTRKRSTKKYLPSHYTINLMYDEYKTKTDKPVSMTVYRQIVNELNIKIKQPHKDTCNTCDKLNMQILNVLEGKEELLTTLKKHQEEADFAYVCKAEDKKESLEKDSRLTTIMFDLQQCLPTPQLDTSVVFYKRLLWTYNLTIHEAKNSQAYCFMWSENIGGRGADQIASCVATFLKENVEDSQHLIMYSDTCGGQNKNSHFVAMLMSVLKEHQTLKTVAHKFLTAGHTHLECDTDHALIEKEKKKNPNTIYHPHDWMQLVKRTGKKNPFIVREMMTEDFMGYSGLLKNSLSFKKRNDFGEKFVWKDVKWLELHRSDPTTLLYKTTLKKEDPFKTLSCAKKGKSSLIPQRSYGGDIAIAQAKKKDLVDLLYLVPTVFHNFYKNLKSDGDVPDTGLASDSEISE